MEAIVIRVLVLEPHAGLRKAIASVRSVPGFDHVAIEPIEAETICEALVAMDAASPPHVLIIEPALGGDPADRSALHVILSAQARHIPIIVHTSQRLADSIQTELALLHIPMLIKTVDSVALMQLAVLRALKADRPIGDVFDAFVRVACYLRALPGSVADNVKQVLALAVEDAVKEHRGNKTAAAESLGVDRNFVWRIVRNWLPQRKHFVHAVAPHASERTSETRLRMDALAKAGARRMAQGE